MAGTRGVESGRLSIPGSFADISGYRVVARYDEGVTPHRDAGSRNV